MSTMSSYESDAEIFFSLTPQTNDEISSHESALNFVVLNTAD